MKWLCFKSETRCNRKGKSPKQLSGKDYWGLQFLGSVMVREFWVSITALLVPIAVLRDGATPPDWFSSSDP